MSSLLAPLTDVLGTALPPWTSTFFAFCAHSATRQCVVPARPLPAPTPMYEQQQGGFGFGNACMQPPRVFREHRA